MRISDWSSDVCSSDLRGDRRGGGERHRLRIGQRWQTGEAAVAQGVRPQCLPIGRGRGGGGIVGRGRIARRDHERGAERPARKSVVAGKSVSVRVKFGGRRSSKKKKTNTH